MANVLRSFGRRKRRILRQVRVINREEYDAMDLDVRVQTILDLIPLGLMYVQMTLEEEVERLAGDWHERKGIEHRGRRYGSNPGSVRLGGQKFGIRVPRVRDLQGEVPLRSYRRFHTGGGEVDERLMRRVLYGISCRDYERAAESVPGAMGMSSSSVSRAFIEASAAQLRAFQERDLSSENYVTIFMDGKTFADVTMVVALGITIKGEKKFLGFVETDTENERVITEFLRSLLARGLDISSGVLMVVDGAKGLRAAIRKAFPKRAAVQRCMWHKRENVVSHLPKRDQASWRRRLQRAMDRPGYDEALKALRGLHAELEQINQSAAASLAEGLDEVLTLHRLGMFSKLGRSFKTTNCLENVNSLIGQRLARIDCWKNSAQRQRWLATVLIDIEPRLRHVMGMRHLAELQAAVQRELKIEVAAPHARAA